MPYAGNRSTGGLMPLVLVFSFVRFFLWMIVIVVMLAIMLMFMPLRMVVMRRWPGSGWR